MTLAYFSVLALSQVGDFDDEKSGLFHDDALGHSWKRLDAYTWSSAKLTHSDPDRVTLLTMVHACC